MSKTTIEVNRVLGRPQYTVCYEEGRVTLPIGVINYDAIVDAIITQRYPSDKMMAVINNYMLSPEKEAIAAEWQEMQAWRKRAKEVAKEAIELL